MCVKQYQIKHSKAKPCLSSALLNVPHGKIEVPCLQYVLTLEHLKHVNYPQFRNQKTNKKKYQPQKATKSTNQPNKPHHTKNPSK